MGTPADLERRVVGRRRAGMLLLTTDLSHRGGIGAYGAQLAAALREVRPELPLHIISLNIDPAVAIPSDTTIAEVPGHRAFGIAAMQHGLRRRPNEIIINHLHLVPLGLVVARLSGAKLTVVLHGFEVWRGRRRHLRLLGNYVDRVIAVSRYTAEQADRFFYRWGPRRFGQITLLPPAVDPEAYQPQQSTRDPFRAAHGFNPDDLVILTVGRLDASEMEKGHDRVIQSLDGLVSEFPTLKYLIVGVGDDQPRLERLVADLGLVDVVTFAGFVDDLASCYSGADLFVMPSSQEGFGIVYIEALASGIPVVAGGIDGSVEAVLYGEVGYLCDPRSRESLIRAITTALRQRATDDPRSDPKTLRQRVIEAFGPAAMAERVDQLLES